MTRRRARQATLLGQLDEKHPKSIASTAVGPMIVCIYMHIYAKARELEIMSRAFFKDSSEDLQEVFTPAAVCKPLFRVGDAFCYTFGLAVRNVQYQYL